MKAMKDALNGLIEGFEDFTENLRQIVDDLPQVGPAGAGEERDEAVRQAPARENIDDDTVITMKSGDLRKVVDAYRRLSRYAREGRIPTQEQRFKLHQSIRAVKHLIRKPIRD